MARQGRRGAGGNEWRYREGEARQGLSGAAGNEWRGRDGEAQGGMSGVTGNEWRDIPRRHSPRASKINILN